MKIKPTNKSGGVLLELKANETTLPGVSDDAAFATSPLFRLKKILVPIDFSECSDKALQYAVPLARQFDSELTLLHVVQPIPPVPEMYTFPVESLTQSKEDLEALCNAVQPSVECRPVVRSGNPAREILNAAKELGIDLLVISTHGHTGLTRAILGSTTEQVVRHAPCPVLVVRRKEHEFIAQSVGSKTQNSIPSCQPS